MDPISQDGYSDANISLHTHHREPAFGVTESSLQGEHFDVLKVAVGGVRFGRSTKRYGHLPHPRPPKSMCAAHRALSRARSELSNSR